MRSKLAPALVLVLPLVSGSPAVVAAQPAADSAAIMRAVGDTLSFHEARAVVDRFVCHDGEHPCPAPAGEAERAPDPLVAELARAAGARLVPATRDHVPPCPWDRDPRPEAAGYLIGVASLELEDDAASVLVVSRCVNPPGYLHPIFGRDDRIVLRREGDAWRVTAIRMTRIT